MHLKLSLTFLACLAIKYSVCSPSFSINYDSNTFIKDGKPFKYVSGSIHSYRIPKELWYDRLYKMWAAGLNAIETYIFWNEHEQEEGVYNFEGQYNVFEFFEMAQKIGFVVILRPGPYICGEHEYGGLPWWLLRNGTDKIVPRSSETNYMNAVNRWFGVFLPKVYPYLYQNGGPIITVQVENEYGAFYTCDVSYRNQLRDLFRKYLGNEVVLFTTDGNPFERIGCGVIENVYSTIDFGIDRDVNETFALQRKYSPKGPLVNSEFYPGWLDFWGKPHEKRDTKLVIPPLQQILNLNASVNFYMFHGGTNFGFSAGAHPPYLIQPTSYDYDAPLSEAGDITQKYLSIKNEISNFFPIPNVPQPQNSTKISLGKVKLDKFIPLLSLIITECVDSYVESVKPLPFEKLGQGYGIVLYYTFLDNPNVDGKILSIPGIRDRAYVLVGNVFIGVLDRVNGTELKINLPNNLNNTLSVIVENTGRLCYGDDLLDAKGILSDVYLDGKVVKNWYQCLSKNHFPYYQINVTKSALNKYKDSQYSLIEKTDPIVFKAPNMYIGELNTITDNNFDTFLKLDQFSKGMVFIDNGDVFTNLGRYWPKVGPQVTLYTPGVLFSTKNTNFIYIVDFEGSSCDIDNCYIDFIDYPIIDNL